MLIGDHHYHVRWKVYILGLFVLCILLSCFAACFSLLFVMVTSAIHLHANVNPSYIAIVIAMGEKERYINVF